VGSSGEMLKIRFRHKAIFRDKHAEDFLSFVDSEPCKLSGELNFVNGEWCSVSMDVWFWKCFVLRCSVAKILTHLLMMYCCYVMLIMTYPVGSVPIMARATQLCLGSV
jgi:hypothetical protein